MKYDKTRLQNYAAEEWVTGTGTGTTLVHAVTGETDRRGELRGTRLRGHGSTTRDASAAPHSARMTFHERALMLKEMAKYLTDAKGRVLQLSRGDRRDENRFVDRHRWRHRHVLRLREQGPPRVP